MFWLDASSILAQLLSTQEAFWFVCNGFAESKVIESQTLFQKAVHYEAEKLYKQKEQRKTTCRIIS